MRRGSRRGDTPWWPSSPSQNSSFDTIMLSAAWMHFDESERHAGVTRLASLLSPGGVMVLSLRHGPVPVGRRMFQVSGEETIELAGQHGLRPVLNVRTESIQALNRADGVTWTRLAFRHSSWNVLCQLPESAYEVNLARQGSSASCGSPLEHVFRLW